MKAILYAVALTAVQAAQFATPIETVPICENRNTIQPPTTETIVVNRIAWPILGSSFTGPVSVNDVPSLSPPSVICMNCEDPPCPTVPCAAESLYWSVAFDNAVVPPGPILLSDSPTLPETLVTFYEPWSPSQTPSPMPSPSVTPSQTPTNMPCPACELGSPCLSNNQSAVVGVAVAFGFVCITTLILVFFLFRSRAVECPYCNQKVPPRGLKPHLYTCSEHGKLFSTVVIDRVRVVRESVAAGPVCGEDREDEVARPESVAFVPTTR